MVKSECLWYFVFNYVSLLRIWISCSIVSTFYANLFPILCYKYVLLFWSVEQVRKGTKRFKIWFVTKQFWELLMCATVTNTTKIQEQYLSVSLGEEYHVFLWWHNLTSMLSWNAWLASSHRHVIAHIRSENWKQVVEISWKSYIGLDLYIYLYLLYR